MHYNGFLVCSVFLPLSIIQGKQALQLFAN